MPQSMCLFFVMCMDSIPNFQAQQSLIGDVWTHPPMFLGTCTKQILQRNPDRVGAFARLSYRSSRIKRSQGVPLEILRSNHAVSLAQIRHKMLHGHKNRARNPEYSRLDIRTKKNCRPFRRKTRLGTQTFPTICFSV